MNEMIPSARLVVYTFGEDKEMVGDSHIIKIEDKLYNKVTILTIIT